MLLMVAVLLFGFFVMDDKFRTEFITISAAIIGGGFTLAGILSSNSNEKKKRILETKPILTVPSSKSMCPVAKFSSNDKEKNIRVILRNSGKETFRIKSITVCFNNNIPKELKSKRIVYVNSEENLEIFFCGVKHNLSYMELALRSIDKKDFYWKAKFEGGLLTELDEYDRNGNKITN